MTTKVKFFTLYEPPKSTALEVPKEDYCVEATEQTHKESDINELVRRYNLGDIAAMSGIEKAPVFGDFSKAVTYEDSKQAVIDAERQFMTLPPELRQMFSNDPGKLIAWVDDPKNFDKAIELGLIAKPDGYITPAEREERQKEAELIAKAGEMEKVQS